LPFDVFGIVRGGTSRISSTSSPRRRWISLRMRSESPS